MAQIYASVPSPPQPSFGSASTPADQEVYRQLEVYEDPDGIQAHLYSYQHVRADLVREGLVADREIEIRGEDATDGDETRTDSGSSIHSLQRVWEGGNILCQSGDLGHTTTSWMV